MDIKSVSWIFVKELLILGLELILVVLVVLIIFNNIVSKGYAVPAGYACDMIKANEQKIATMDTFDDGLIPRYTTYARYDNNGELIYTTMSDEELYICEHPRSEDDISKYDIMYVIPREDGKVVICYDCVPQFTNEFLYKHLPNIEVTMFIIVGVIMVVCIGMSAFRIRKAQKKGLEPLKEEISKINHDSFYDFSTEPVNVKASRISEIANIQQSLVKSREELATKLRAEWENEQIRKNNIAALVHDIKTPLTVISGNAELLEEDASSIRQYIYDRYAVADNIEENDESTEYNKQLIKMSEDMDELCKAVLRGCNRIQGYMALLVDQNIESKKMDIILSVYQEELIQQVNDLCSAAQIPVKIISNCIDEQIKIHVDVQRTQRAIMNLVRNAIDYTDKEKGIVITSYIEDNYCIYQVDDYGDGFSDEALEHYMDQFFTEDKARTGYHFGLGMYFASEVAKECNGKLVVTNTENGASVRFEIPLVN